MIGDTQLHQPEPRGKAIIITIDMNGILTESLLATSEREEAVARRIHERIAPVLRNLQAAAQESRR